MSNALLYFLYPFGPKKPTAAAAEDRDKTQHLAREGGGITARM